MFALLTVTAATSRVLAPWKMTYASTSAAAARDFAARYLNASKYGNEPGGCGDIQWVYWSGAPYRVPELDRKLFDREGGHLHLHFVEHEVKPAGAMSIAE